MQQGRLKGRALYIGFGSMGAEGLVPEAQRLAKVLLDTAAQSFVAEFSYGNQRLFECFSRF